MKINILGVKIDNITKKEVLRQIEHFLESQQPHYIVTPYSEFIVRAQKDLEFRKIINNADIAISDGSGIMWAGNFLIPRDTHNNTMLRRTVLKRISYFLKTIWQLFSSLFLLILFPNKFKSVFPEKNSGVDLVWDIAELAQDLRQPIFLLGGWGDTPGTVAATLKSRFPLLHIVGTYSGNPETEKEKIISMVKEAGPSVLLVAFGPVKQEKWIAENLRKIPSLKLAIGLGGTFDYLAGKRILAPNFIRVRGLEWLFRLFTQPWRIGRIGKTMPKFVWLIFKEKLKINS